MSNDHGPPGCNAAEDELAFLSLCVADGRLAEGIAAHFTLVRGLGVTAVQWIEPTC